MGFGNIGSLEILSSYIDDTHDHLQNLIVELDMKDNLKFMEDSLVTNDMDDFIFDKICHILKHIESMKTSGHSEIDIKFFVQKSIKKLDEKLRKKQLFTKMFCIDPCENDYQNDIHLLTRQIYQNMDIKNRRKRMYNDDMDRSEKFGNKINSSTDKIHQENISMKYSLCPPICPLMYSPMCTMEPHIVAILPLSNTSIEKTDMDHNDVLHHDPYPNDHNPDDIVIKNENKHNSNVCFPPMFPSMCSPLCLSNKKTKLIVIS